MQKNIRGGWNVGSNTWALRTKLVGGRGVLYYNWKLPSNWKEVTFEGVRGTVEKRRKKGSSGQQKTLLIARYVQDRFRKPNLT